MSKPKKPTSPKLGQRIRASGYMVRYRPEINWIDTRVTRICWKRHSGAAWGVFFGIRHLSIGWLFPDGQDGLRCRKVGTITVYAIAVNRRSVRYVLPVDVEMGEKTGCPHCGRIVGCARHSRWARQHIRDCEEIRQADDARPAAGGAPW